MVPMLEELFDAVAKSTSLAIMAWLCCCNQHRLYMVQDIVHRRVSGLSLHSQRTVLVYLPYSEP